MRRSRLIWQVLFAAASIATAVAALLGIHAARRAASFCESAIWNKLEVAASACNARLAASISPGAYLGEGQAARANSTKLRDVCRELSDQLDIRLTIILPSGKVVADSSEDAATMDNHRERPEIVAALSGSAGHSIRMSTTRRELFMYLAVPVWQGKEVAAVVRTSVPSVTFSRVVTPIYVEIALTGILFATLAIGGTFLVVRRLARSIDDVRHGVEHFAQGDWKYRLPDFRSEEFGMLADSLNAMATHLDERIQKILHQQSEHQAMLSSMEEGVMAVDRSGTVLSINEPCAALLGVEVEKLRGRSIYETLRKPDLLKFIERSLESTRSLDGDLRFYSPEERWLLAHGTPLHDARNQRIGVLVVLHDVTRLRHLENVRRDFVANVSHELRTPITSIKGFVETLIDDGFDDRANATRFLGIVLRQVNRLDAIINDLLLLSRVERGNDDQRIETDAEPIVDILRVAMETCEKKAHDKSVEVVVDCQTDLVAKINAPLLEQAVINLIDNAIKYSEAGSSVRVEAFRDDNSAVIRVLDNGCGIAANHVPRLFERFYRVDKARSRELGGTGLGLAIVKHIMTAHQGTVHVESVVGRGSIFSLRLPLTPQATKDQATKDQAPNAPAFDRLAVGGAAVGGAENTVMHLQG